MRVSEAISKWNTVLGKEIEIEGVAEISHAISVIYDGREKRGVGEPISPGVLVHGNHLQALVESLPNPLAAYAGSEILYIVNVRVVGIVANTGHTFAPLKFGHIYEIEFDDDHTGIQKITVNGRLKDILFTIKRSLKAKEVKEFERYFPSFGNMIELKSHLECGDSLVLINRVIETDVSDHIGVLEKLDIEYELKDSPIENALWGMP